MGAVPVDWLTEHKVVWSFHSDKLRACVDGRWCDLTLVRTNEKRPKKQSTPVASLRTPAELAYDILAEQVADMPLDEASALLHPQPRRYKSPRRGRRNVKTDTLLQRAKENAATVALARKRLCDIIRQSLDDGVSRHSLQQLSTTVSDKLAVVLNFTGDRLQGSIIYYSSCRIIHLLILFYLNLM